MSARSDTPFDTDTHRLGAGRLPRQASSMAVKALDIIGGLAMLALVFIAILLAAAFSGVGTGNVVVRKFISILFEHPFLVPGCLILLPTCLRRRSMFIGFSAALGVLLGAVWVIDEYQRRQANHADSGAGAAFGLAVFLLLAMSFALGVAVRVVLYTILQWKQASCRGAPGVGARR